MQFVVDEKCLRTGELFSRNVFTTIRYIIFTEKSQTQTQLLIIPRPLCGWSKCYEWIYNPNYSLQCVTLCIFPVNLTKWPHNYLPTATWSSPRRSTSAAQVHSYSYCCCVQNHKFSLHIIDTFIVFRTRMTRPLTGWPSPARGSAAWRGAPADSPLCPRCKPPHRSGASTCAALETSSSCQAATGPGSTSK